jgi:hypothetical protein
MLFLVLRYTATQFAYTQYFLLIGKARGAARLQARRPDGAGYGRFALKASTFGQIAQEWGFGQYFRIRNNESDNRAAGTP